MEPDPRPIIRSQYHAALDMFAAAVEAIPDEAWDRPEDVNRTWHLAFHTLFYVHFYLHPTQDDFEPWPEHRRYYDLMGAVPWPPEDGTEVGEPLSREGLREYLALCREQVDLRTAELDLGAPSGFPWLPMNKLELQLYSLRHTMQHVGELYERVAKTSGAELPWVGMGARSED